MMLSWADRRLGAVDGDDVSVSRSEAVPAPERAMDLHAVRTSPAAAEVGTGAAPVMEPWETAWRRSLSWQRALRQRQFCEQIRDAKADGRRPLAEDEFFVQRETILEL